MARIVFDLDGTLIDSAPDIQGVANRLLAGEGAAPITLAETRSFVGNGAATFVARMRAARGIDDAAQASLLAEFVALYDDAVSLTHPCPGVMDALTALSDAGHVLGICTNKPIQPCHAVLRHLRLDGYFETVLGGDSLPVRKPDPAPLHRAFEEMGNGPKLYVGDSDVDAETAERARIPFLLFTEGYRKSPVNRLPHHRSFNNFNDLPGIVEAALKDAA